MKNVDYSWKAWEKHGINLILSYIHGRRIQFAYGHGENIRKIKYPDLEADTNPEGLASALQLPECRGVIKIVPGWAGTKRNDNNVVVMLLKSINSLKSKLAL